jgi:hypothetical protein
MMSSIKPEKAKVLQSNEKCGPTYFGSIVGQVGLRSTIAAISNNVWVIMPALNLKVFVELSQKWRAANSISVWYL